MLEAAWDGDVESVELAMERGASANTRTRVRVLTILLMNWDINHVWIRLGRVH